MKKLSYRDKLLELAYIYNVKEIQDYTKSRKTLTTGQIELILKKNKIIIPKDFKSSFFRDNFTKPISKLKSSIIDYKEEKLEIKIGLLDGLKIINTILQENLIMVFLIYGRVQVTLG